MVFCTSTRAFCPTFSERNFQTSLQVEVILQSRVRIGSGAILDSPTILLNLASLPFGHFQKYLTFTVLEIFEDSVALFRLALNSLLPF